MEEDEPEGKESKESKPLLDRRTGKPLTKQQMKAKMEKIEDQPAEGSFRARMVVSNVRDYPSVCRGCATSARHRDGSDGVLSPTGTASCKSFSCPFVHLSVLVLRIVCFAWARITACFLCFFSLRRARTMRMTTPRWRQRMRRKEAPLLLLRRRRHREKPRGKKSSSTLSNVSCLRL